jgi:hypothetical protein
MESVLHHVIITGMKRIQELLADCQQAQSTKDFTEYEIDSFIEQTSEKILHHLIVLHPTLPLARRFFPADSEFIRWCDDVFENVTREEIGLCDCNGCGNKS